MPKYRFISFKIPSIVRPLVSAMWDQLHLTSIPRGSAAAAKIAKAFKAFVSLRQKNNNNKCALRKHCVPAVTRIKSIVIVLLNYPSILFHDILYIAS